MSRYSLVMVGGWRTNGQVLGSYPSRAEAEEEVAFHVVTGPIPYRHPRDPGYDVVEIEIREEG